MIVLFVRQWSVFPEKAEHIIDFFLFIIGIKGITDLKPLCAIHRRKGEQLWEKL